MEYNFVLDGLGNNFQAKQHEPLKRFKQGDEQMTDTNTTEMKVKAKRIGKPLFNKSAIKKGMRYNGTQKHCVLTFLKNRQAEGSTKANPKFLWGTMTEVKEKYGVGYLSAMDWFKKAA